MPITIPNEIVEEIIQHLLEIDESRSSNGTVGENSKPDWKFVESFTLASWNFRLLSLAAWFRTLYLQSASDIQDIQAMFPALKERWTRHLHCVRFHDSQHLVWDLSGFKRLSAIRVDWLYQNLTPLYAMEDPEIVPFINVDSPIKELDIRGVRYPTPMILRAFTSPLQNLVTLKVESLRTWCGLCHTCTLIRFPSPNPTGLLYEGGLGLSVHYARSLFSLKYLEEVIFTLPDTGSGLRYPGFSQSQSDENMWTGECDRCMALMYDDLTFKNNWMSRKRGINVDGVDPRSIYTKPPNLKMVQWNFWLWDSAGDNMTYSQEELDVDDEVLFDTIEIHNSEDETSEA